MKTKKFSYENRNNKGKYLKTINKKRKVITFRVEAILIIVIMLLINLLPLHKVYAGALYTQTVKNGIEAFPESYQVLLKQFVDDTFHSNWNFQAYYTGIDWNDFVTAEGVHGRNRVHQSFDSAYRCSCYDLASGYYCANSQITSYFMDPRNFINERNIFQFLDVSYNEQIYTREIVEKLVEKYKVFNNGQPITFVMSDKNHPMYNQQVTMTYTDIIMEAAKASKMSPISMIIKIVQEVGASGSASTDGKSATYPNTYNFFNIGASDTGDAILNGLSYANSNGWHCPYTSIVEGAVFNSDNYIKAGQNTAYFYKYDCVGNKILNANETQQITPDDLYHQYMTNIQDPYSQSATLFTTYTNNNLLNESLNFIIPVFDNMPTQAVNKLSSLSNSDKDLYYANVSSSLKIRTEPNTTSDILRYIYKDDLVIMLQRSYTGEWDKVQLWNGQIGYTMSKYLEPFIPNKPEPVEEKKDDPVENKPISKEPIANIGYGYANVSTSLNVRKGPGTSYAVEIQIPAKQEFIIIEESDNWMKIRLADGTVGYVLKDYVTSLGYIKIDEENKTISVIPNITPNIVAGKLGITEYIVKKNDVEVTDNSLGTGYVIKSGDKEYTIIKMGDVNGDGKTNTVDALIALKYDVGQLELKDNLLKALDVNKDGKYNTVDALILLKCDVGLEKINL